ncbi:hypothetical protein D3C86_1845210 [compost metagenome]
MIFASRSLLVGAVKLADLFFKLMKDGAIDAPSYRIFQFSPARTEVPIYIFSSSCVMKFVCRQIFGNPFVCVSDAICSF